MEPYQKTPELVRRISDEGIVSRLNDCIKQLGRYGIVQRLVRSALERKHLEEARGKDNGIFLDAVPELVGDEDAAALGADDGKGLREAEQLALDLFKCFQNGNLLSAKKKKLLTVINKRCLNDYFGASNQTVVSPGKGKQPFLSVYCTPITFYRRTLLEYEHSVDIRPYKDDESKGKHGRRLSTELTALAADRVIRGLAEGNEEKQQRALDNFKKIIAALDRDGWLFEALSGLEKKKQVLSVGTEALFDSARQDIVNNALQPTGGGSSEKGAGSEEDGEEVDDDDDDNDVAQAGRKSSASGERQVLFNVGVVWLFLESFESAAFKCIFGGGEPPGKTLWQPDFKAMHLESPGNTLSAT